ncbi:MAG: hypothetical protein WCJ57_02395 [Candidatus Falkowbacteria bacterium]
MKQKLENGPKSANEFCLVILRNDLIKNGRVPDAFKDLLSLKGIKMVHGEMIMPTRSLMEKFCHKDDTWLIAAGQKTVNILRATQQPLKKDVLEYGYDILRSIIDYNTEGVFWALLLFGPDACARINKLVGDINPEQAGYGSMRAKYSSDSGYKAFKEARAIRNCVDCSESPSNSLFQVGLLWPGLNLNNLVSS